MKMTSMTLIAQRTLLALNVLQMTYLAIGYLKGTLFNQYPVLEALFKPEVANVCTKSGCWQSIVPFLGSMYLATALISILALFFRAGRELKLTLVGLASVHIFMATIRLTIAPSHMYIEGAAMQASTVQFIVGGVMLLSAAIPYAKNRV